MTQSAYYKACQRETIQVLGRNYSGYSEAMVIYDTLPERYKSAVRALYGEPRDYIAKEPIKNLVRHDDAARKYYAEKYHLPDGRELPIVYQRKYSRACDWLNVIKLIMEDKRTLKDTLQITMADFWANFTTLASAEVKEHGLPTSVDRMRKRFNAYQEGGYRSLVEEWRFGNDFARVVTPKIENLIIALAAQPYKPTMAEVCRDYRAFIRGEKEVVDVETGEVFDPKEFYVDNEPHDLGESTVDYYIKKPVNLTLLNKARMRAIDFNSVHRPSVARKAAQYAFSMITMDDIDLPFHMIAGGRVVCYEIFDVASNAVVG
ncbi:MAG: hypothetical protein EBZ77_10180, partial [Chitinophagia bacterium]|nr:hypothetical protein [Chitinophagia bacterium]